MYIYITLICICICGVSPVTNCLIKRKKQQFIEVVVSFSCPSLGITGGTILTEGNCWYNEFFRKISL